MDNSLIPRAFSPTDARRAREEAAREAERRSSARNARTSTIDADGKLLLAGGIEVVDGGTVEVIGETFTPAGAPSKIRVALTNVELEGNYGAYLAPTLKFSTDQFGESARARIDSNDGRDIQMFAAQEGSGGAWAGVSNGGFNAGFGDESPGYGDTTGEYREASIQAGRYGFALKFRDDLNGARSGIVADGNGNIDLQTTGTFTQNGAPIAGAADWAGITGKPATFPPTIGSTATTAKAGDYTPTIAGVTGLQAALDAKAAKVRFKKLPGTSLPGTLTAAYASFNALQTVPADLFGPGVPYIISVYGQIQANPPAGATIVIRALFNGAQPNGAKVNGGAAPNFGVTSLQYDYEVTTSTAVTVDVQASSQGANSTRGTGGDEPFYTIKVQPYTAL